MKLRGIFLSLFIFVFAGLHGQTYTLNGVATALGGDCYQLTPSLSYQSGTVWYTNQIDLNNPFDLQFIMNFGNLDVDGADGICFVLQTVGNTAIGTDGGGMGYLDFGTSIGIEFDTYQNGSYSDPAEDHIAIEQNGDINHASAASIAGPVQASSSNANIEDGEDHIVRITWNPQTFLIEVYFDCEFRLSGTINMIDEIFGGQNLVYWGFTSATGGLWNDQVVCLTESIINQTEVVSTCTGASVELNAGPSSDGVYTWSPTDFLSDPNSGNPSANPPVSTTYTVNFNDICGQPTQLSFVVNVTDLEATVGSIETLNCENQVSSILADLNFNLPATYTWSQNGTELASGPNPSFNATQPGTYTLEVNIQDQCFDEVDFEVPSENTTYTVDAGPDLYLNCLQESVTISGSYDGDNGIMGWLYNNAPVPNATGSTLTASDPGTYTFFVTDPASGCVSSDAVFVAEDFSTPLVSIGDQDSLSCAFPVIEIKNVNIESANAYAVIWSTDNGSFSGGINSVNAFVNSSGTYTITVQDEVSGCTSSADVYIGQASNYDVDLSSLTFPNIVSANGDSRNDKWLPFLARESAGDLSSAFAEFDLKIYDRWGKLVFESSSYNSAWTGKDQEDGVYYYLLRYRTYCNGGKSGNIEGSVQLVR